MIDRNVIDRAGEALDELFAAVEREHPGFELIVRSNLDGAVFHFEGDDQVVMGDRIFANLTGDFRRGSRLAFKAYADTSADALASVMGRATGVEGSS